MTTYRKFKFKPQGGRANNPCTDCEDDWYCVQFSYKLAPPNVTHNPSSLEREKRSLWFRADGQMGFATGEECDLEDVDPGDSDLNIVDLQGMIYQTRLMLSV